MEYGRRAAVQRPLVQVDQLKVAAILTGADGRRAGDESALPQPRIDKKLNGSIEAVAERIRVQIQQFGGVLGQVIQAAPAGEFK